MSMIVNLLVAASLCIFRVIGYKSQAFQAIAHLYMGGLFMGAYSKKSWLLWGVFTVLCVVEVFCFLRDKNLL